MRQRQGLVYCWEHHKIGNTVYIHYDGLKDKYKALIRKEICNGLEVQEWLKYNTIRAYLPPVVQSEKDTLSGYVITRERLNTATGELYQENRTGLPDEYVSLLLYQSQWYRLMGKDVYNYHKRDLKRLGISGMSAYRDVCINIANSPTDIFRRVPGCQRMLPPVTVTRWHTKKRASGRSSAASMEISARKKSGMNNCRF